MSEQFENSAVELIHPQWPAPPGVRAVCSTRIGGVSEGPYESLNLGTHVDDAPQAVMHNRQRLRAAAQMPEEPRWLEQVHGRDILRFSHGDRPDTPPRADAAWTADAGVVCCVMTADCLPVLLCTRDGTRVAAVHAGWRGIANAIIGATVAALGGGELIAWLGPAISQAAYEVGDEVREACIGRNAAAAAAFEHNARGRWQADLYLLARQALVRSGVEQIFGGDYCTHSDAARFFSHRRQAPCGRMATAIWIDAAA